MRFLSQMAQDEGVISDSKLTEGITWLQSLPDWAEGLFNQNPWLVGGVAAFIGLAVLVKLGKN